MFDLLSSANFSFNQQTLADSFTFVGRGLHSGLKVVMSVLPAEPDTGYVFIRRDVDAEHGKISGLWHNVVDTHLSTTLGNNLGTRVRTVEHILAALYASGVDNARIVLDSQEVPIADGSSAPFMSIIDKIGKRDQALPRRAVVIRQPFCIREGDKVAQLNPSLQPWMDIEIDFDNPVIGRQYLSLPLNSSVFAEEIASARTFGFKEQLAMLQELGFARGGSINNAILVDDDRVLCRDGLRFTDEFVRHKYLDTVGDLALLGARLLGRFSGKHNGHRLNNLLLNELMSNQECWVCTTLEDAYVNWLELVDGPGKKKLSAALALDD